MPQTSATNILNASEERDSELVPRKDPRSSIISIDPERKGGAPCFAGTRVPVKDLWDYLAGGDDIDSFLDSFPTVKREQVVAAIHMAGSRLLDGLPEH